MRKAIFILTVTLIVTTLLFSGYQLWRYFTVEKEVGEQFDELAEQIQQTPPLLEQPGEPPPEWTVYDQYGALFEQNPDMIGWISIDGTAINYPVMQTPDRPNFYLKHNFEKQYSDYGVTDRNYKPLRVCLTTFNRIRISLLNKGLSEIAHPKQFDKVH